MANNKLEEILAKHAKNTDYKLEVIMDGVSTIKSGVNELEGKANYLEGKVNIIFDQVGKLTEDMEVVKHIVQRHEQKIVQP